MHARDHRLVHVEQNHREPLRTLELPAVVVEVAGDGAVLDLLGVACSPRVGAGEVVACAEVLTRAGEHHHVDVLPRVGLEQRRVQLLEHLRRQRVALVRTVQRDPCNALTNLEQQALRGIEKSAHCLSPAHRFALVCVSRTPSQGGGPANCSRSVTLLILPLGSRGSCVDELDALRDTCSPR